MEYTEFETRALDILEKTQGYRCPSQAIRDKGLVAQWVVGGQGGGSCWGDEADNYLGAETEPELEEIDLILEELTPSMTFIQYKRLIKDVTVQDTYTENEYYGNYTRYATKTIRLDKLHNELMVRGLL